MINLLPPEYQQNYQVSEKQFLRLLLSFFVLLLIVAVVAMNLNLFFEYRILQEKEIIVQDNLEVLEEKASGLDEIREKKEHLEMALETGEGKMLSNVRAAERIFELEDIVFSGVWIQNFMISEDRKFQIVGYSLEQIKINDLIDNVDDSIEFETVFATQISKDLLPLGEYNKDEINHFSVVGSLDRSLNLGDGINIDTSNLGINTSRGSRNTASQRRGAF